MKRQSTSFPDRRLRLHSSMSQGCRDRMAEYLTYSPRRRLRSWTTAPTPLPDHSAKRHPMCYQRYLPRTSTPTCKVASAHTRRGGIRALLPGSSMSYRGCLPTSQPLITLFLTLTSTSSAQLHLFFFFVFFSFSFIIFLLVPL